MTRVTTFTGQGFSIPEGATPILTLKGFTLLLPETAWEFNSATPSISADTLVQGAFLRFGKGRVVVFGEAALFTAQGTGRQRVGINAASGAHNVTLLLNIVHWLTGLLD